MNLVILFARKKLHPEFCDRVPWYQIEYKMYTYKFIGRQIEYHLSVVVPNMFLRAFLCNTSFKYIFFGQHYHTYLIYLYQIFYNYLWLPLIKQQVAFITNNWLRLWSLGNDEKLILYTRMATASFDINDVQYTYQITKFY